MKKGYKQKFITEIEVELYDRDFFGDEDPHEYNVKCYDGHAEATATGNGYPSTLKMTYPTLKSLTRADREEIRDYRGLPFNERVHFGDVMLCMGKITR